MSRRLPIYPDRLPRPLRPVVCGTCRTALVAGEPCDVCPDGPDGTDGRLFRLARARERRAFIDEVWSEVARRRQRQANAPGLDDIIDAGADIVDLIALGRWAGRDSGFERRTVAARPGLTLQRVF